jgi:hypothetical protein
MRPKIQRWPTWPRWPNLEGGQLPPQKVRDPPGSDSPAQPLGWADEKDSQDGRCAYTVLWRGKHGWNDRAAVVNGRMCAPSPARHSSRHHSERTPTILRLRFSGPLVSRGATTSSSLGCKSGVRQSAAPEGRHRFVSSAANCARSGRTFDVAPPGLSAACQIGRRSGNRRSARGHPTVLRPERCRDECPRGERGAFVRHRVVRDARNGVFHEKTPLSSLTRHGPDVSADIAPLAPSWERGRG